MKSTLLGSFIKVFAFWWMVLYFIAPFQSGVFLDTFINGLLITSVAAFGGGLIALSYYWSEREDRKDKIKPTSYRGMNLSMGPLPLVAVPKMAKGWFIPADLSDWYHNYKVKNARHADLIEAGLAVMKAKPCMASPVKGGHGNLNLTDHSFNVLRQIIKIAPHWEYAGSKNKKGKIVQELDNPDYKFDYSDPIIPIIGLLHDIGKITCYDLQPDGTTKEVRNNHDIEGGKLIVKLPVFWELSEPDRTAIIMCLSHYHHPIAMPLWADDRIRALTELLIAADNQAGKLEGGSIYHSKSAFFTLPENDEDNIAVNYTPPKGAERDNLDGAKVAAVIMNDEDDPEGGGTGSLMLNVLSDLLCETGRINGGDSKLRIGFKSNGYIYIQETKMREALAKSTGDDSLVLQLAQGLINPKTLCLMARLNAMNALYCVHEGYKFGPLTAFFNVEGFAADGRLLTNWKYTIIIKAETFPSLANIPDCPRPLTVTKPTLGFNKAQDKNKGPVHKNPETIKPLQDAADKADAIIEADSAENEQYLSSIEEGLGNLNLDDVIDERERPDVIDNDEDEHIAAEVPTNAVPLIAPAPIAVPVNAIPPSAPPQQAIPVEVKPVVTATPEPVVKPVSAPVISEERIKQEIDKAISNNEAPSDELLNMIAEKSGIDKSELLGDLLDEIEDSAPAPIVISKPVITHEPAPTPAQVTTPTIEIAPTPIAQVPEPLLQELHSDTHITELQISDEDVNPEQVPTGNSLILRKKREDYGDRYLTDTYSEDMSSGDDDDLMMMSDEDYLTYTSLMAAESDAAMPGTTIIPIPLPEDSNVQYQQEQANPPLNSNNRERLSEPVAIETISPSVEVNATNLNELVVEKEIPYNTKFNDEEPVIDEVISDSLYEKIAELNFDDMIFEVVKDNFKALKIATKKPETEGFRMRVNVGVRTLMEDDDFTINTDFGRNEQVISTQVVKLDEKVVVVEPIIAETIPAVQIAQESLAINVVERSVPVDLEANTEPVLDIDDEILKEAAAFAGDSFEVTTPVIEPVLDVAPVVVAPIQDVQTVKVLLPEFPVVTEPENTAAVVELPVEEKFPVDDSVDVEEELIPVDDSSDYDEVSAPTDDSVDVAEESPPVDDSVDLDEEAIPVDDSSDVEDEPEQEYKPKVDKATERFEEFSKPKKKQAMTEVSEELILSLQLGKAGAEIPFKPKVYFGTNYHMYALEILKDGFPNVKWDEFNVRVVNKTAKGTIHMKGSAGDYIGFKRK